MPRSILAQAKGNTSVTIARMPAGGLILAYLAALHSVYSLHSDCHLFRRYLHDHAYCDIIPPLITTRL